MTEASGTCAWFGSTYLLDIGSSLVIVKTTYEQIIELRIRHTVGYARLGHGSGY
jgi:hypothetical protein